MTNALYVEDNPDNVAIVKLILEVSGYDVMIAGDGIEALNLAAMHKFDFIIMDLHLPNMNGIEATTRLKNNPKTADIPIIALTADIHSRELFMSAGCDIYLNKPIHQAKLLRTVQQVMSVSAVL